MRLLFLLIFLSLASPAASLTTREAVHLLNRTGFPPGMEEVRVLLPLSRKQAVDHILGTLRARPVKPMPCIFRLPVKYPLKLKDLTREQRQLYRKMQRQALNRLKAWWMQEMIRTPSPMTENLTLFWHNHFVSSGLKVKSPEMMGEQNAMLRRYSSGNFKKFVLAVISDGAMLRYLDNVNNRKNAPNENLARELFELFALGEGNYTEQDIKEAARALSGYGVAHNTGRSHFRSGRHDNGKKTIFGKTGNWNRKDLVDIIFAQPESHRFIVKKLWQHYITTPLDERQLTELSRTFARNFELKPLLRSILTSKNFWAPENRWTKIKSPVALLVGMARQFQFEPEKPQFYAQRAASLGQNLLFPPNVKGWPGGKAWINSDTMLRRQNLIGKFTRGMGFSQKVKHQKLQTDDWLLLLLPPTDVSRGNHSPADRYVRKALMNLAYQLH